MTRIHLLVVVLAFAVRQASAVVNNRTCYYPDGTEAPTDMPCSNADTTHCCNSKNACLSTGYCMSAEQAPYVISRGSCTDDGWGTGCPAHCASSSDNPGGGRPISWMGTTNSAGAPLYCCGVVIANDGDLACENNASSFTIGSSTLMYGAAILANTTTVAGSASASASAQPSTVAHNCASDSGSSKTTAVGAGVGASLGAVAVAALAWALWERRKRTKMLQEFRSGRLPAEMVDGSATEDSAMSPGYGGYGKVHNAPQPLAELSAYPRQELPAH